MHHIIAAIYGQVNNLNIANAGSHTPGLMGPPVRTALDACVALSELYELNLRELTRQRHDGVEAWSAWFDAEGSGTDW